MRVSVGEFFALPLAFVASAGVIVAFFVGPIWLASYTHWTVAPALWVSLLSLNYWLAKRDERRRSIQP